MLAPRAKLWSSPCEAVRVALEMIGPLSAEDTVVDVGCGDGRFVIAAAQHGAGRCVGVEVDESRAAEAREAVREAGLASRVEIRCANGLDTHIDDATVVYLYLVPRGLKLMAPRLAGRQRRVVSYMAPIPGLRWSERRTVSPPHQPGAAWPIYMYHLN